MKRKTHACFVICALLLGAGNVLWATPSASAQAPASGQKGNESGPQIMMKET
jgi:hypothetical protein